MGIVIYLYNLYLPLFIADFPHILRGQVNFNGLREKKYLKLWNTLMRTDGGVFRSNGAQKADLKGVDFFLHLLLLPVLSPIQAVQSPGS